MGYATSLQKTPPSGPQVFTQCEACGVPIPVPTSMLGQRPEIGEDGRFVRDDDGKIVRKQTWVLQSALCSGCVINGPYRARKDERRIRRRGKKVRK